MLCEIDVEEVRYKCPNIMQCKFIIPKNDFIVTIHMPRIIFEDKSLKDLYLD